MYIYIYIYICVCVCVCVCVCNLYCSSDSPVLHFIDIFLEIFTNVF